MAEHDSLAQSLSEEESELVLPPPPSTTTTPGGKKKLMTSTGGGSPTRQGKGFKFTPEQKLTSSDFDFASQSKNNTNGSGGGGTSSSSEEEEGFVHLNPEGEMNGGGNGGGPTTPSKLPTPPHKRTAELAETGGGDAQTGANGSPPSSPAPKKRKGWADYVAEHEAKEREGGGGGGSPADPLRKLSDIGGNRNLVLILSMVVLGLAVICAYLFTQTDILEGFGGNPEVDAAVQKLGKAPAYPWKKAHAAFHKSVRKMEKAYPKQNRETWIQLIASISSTLEDTEPSHPTCITVLLPPSLPAAFGTCFATKVASLINTAIAPILQGKPSASGTTLHPPHLITPATFTSSSLTSIRSTIDAYLTSKGKALVATDVDKLRSEPELMLFHGLCDNFRPVDRRATILFPVQVPEGTYDKYREVWSHARGGDISTEVLNTAFGRTVSHDTGPALVARIADAVILLNPGDACE